LEILERGQGLAREGVATLALPNRRVRLRLPAELLAMLTARKQEPADWQDDLATRDSIMQRVVAETHRQPRAWSLRRLPEPLACRDGVLLPDVRLQRGGRQVLVSAVRSTQHGRRLARLATAKTARQFLFVGNENALAPLRATGAICLASETFDVAGLEAAFGVRAPTTLPATGGE
jgi:hypothetical protein